MDEEDPLIADALRKLEADDPEAAQCAKGALEWLTESRSGIGAEANWNRRGETPPPHATVLG